MYREQELPFICFLIGLSTFSQNWKNKLRQLLNTNRIKRTVFVS